MLRNRREYLRHQRGEVDFDEDKLNNVEMATLGGGSERGDLQEGDDRQSSISEARSSEKEGKKTVRQLSVGADVVSSVPLQVTLYYNALFYLLFIVLYIPLFLTKVSESSNSLAQSILYPLVFAIFVVVEPLRLSFGWIGNMKEKVPHLVGFFVLTIFPQTIAAFYLIAWQELIYPLERAVFAVELAVLAPQIVLGFISVRKLMAAQAATVSFYLRQ
mmetsp:Transcript_15058/g.38078  ORF Transcript_15058/g.38078 Transcript_15058/m.38078 type:complete len:217 (-) Transcript_15058:170-820(-)